MNGVIFMHTLRRNWLAMIYWGIGIGLMGLYVMAVLPGVDYLAEYARLLESMPPILLQAFGAESAADLATVEGFVSFGYFSWIMLVMATYAVLAGLNVTANEEDRGILDVVLSQPIPRWRVIIERFAAYALLIAGIILLGHLGLMIGKLMAPGMVIDMGRVFEASLNMLPSSLLVLAFTVFIATVARSRAAAAAIAAVFVVASYFIDVIGNAASGSLAANLGVVSFFSYYDPTTVMSEGLVWSSVLLVLAVTAVLTFASLWFFERRDIGL
jgi:ABC-2 type transport system permease protein